MIVFLDANILFSASYKAHSKLLQIWEVKGVRCVTSEYALDEARRHLNGEQIGRLQDLLQNTQVITDPHHQKIPSNIVLREKDIPILKGALFIQANCLLTGDYRDFGVLFGQTVEGTVILPPAEFLKKYES